METNDQQWVMRVGALVRAAEAPFVTSAGSVDLKRMSESLSESEFRQYITYSREYRKATRN